jgi:hypothetical protein
MKKIIVTLFSASMYVSIEVDTEKLDMLYLVIKMQGNHSIKITGNNSTALTFCKGNEK